MLEIAFEGLDKTDERLMDLREELGYVTLAEVTGRSTVEPLGRVDFNEVDLAPYLEPAGGELGEGLGETSSEDLARAAARWVRQLASGNMTGRSQAKFKVSLWRPKGDAMVHSARFLARNPVLIDDEDDTLSVSPTVQAPAHSTNPSQPEERVWIALGEGYTRLIALSQGTYSHIAGLQNATIVSLNNQNQRLQRLIEELSGDLIHLKIGAAELETGHRAGDGEAKVREELGKQFISELGNLGRVLASSKMGVPPELAELLDSVGSSPELMDALKSPEVRKLLRDDKTRKELAALLKMAAATPTSTDSPPPNPPQDQAQAA